MGFLILQISDGQDMSEPLPESVAAAVVITGAS